MKQFLLAIAILLGLSCNEEKGPATPIVLGDSSTIVTESNPQYLANETNDISPANKKSTEGQITNMMTQIDSAQSVKKLEEKNTSIPLKGFQISFAECEVVFQGLSAHAIQSSQDERQSNSVAYVWDAGNMFEMALQVKGLDEVKVEQRTFTRLYAEQGAEAYGLNDLGKFISAWHTLPGKNNQFISLGNNSLQFFPVDHQKISNAVDRELRKRKKSREDIQRWSSLLKQTNSYTDVPCKLLMVSGQWRIIGKQNGKRVQKLIQFDIPG